MPVPIGERALWQLIGEVMSAERCRKHQEASDELNLDGPSPPGGGRAQGSREGLQPI